MKNKGENKFLFNIIITCFIMVILGILLAISLNNLFISEIDNRKIESKVLEVKSAMAIKKAELIKKNKSLEEAGYLDKKINVHSVSSINKNGIITKDSNKQEMYIINTNKSNDLGISLKCDLRNTIFVVDEDGNVYLAVDDNIRLKNLQNPGNIVVLEE